MNHDFRTGIKCLRYTLAYIILNDRNTAGLMKPDKQVLLISVLETTVRIMSLRTQRSAQVRLLWDSLLKKHKQNKWSTISGRLIKAWVAAQSITIQKLVELAGHMSAHWTQTKHKVIHECMQENGKVLQDSRFLETIGWQDKKNEKLRH